jgi:CHAT domain-containing protein
VAAERQALAARGHPLLEARALWSRAHALTNVGRREEAADHYARASSSYRRLGEPLFAARTALGHVDALMYLGRYKQALAIARAARPVLLRHRELRLVVGLDSNLANILHRLDRPDAALHAYDRALRSARRLGDAERIRGVHFNRANVLVALGRFAEAEDLYQKVRSAAGKAGESWVVALVDYSLGYLCLQRSDYGPAYALLDAARSAFEALGDNHQLALGHLDLAELLLEINRFERAEHHSRRARALCDQLGLRYENAKATLFTAIAALGQGEDERAKKLLAEATTAFRQEGNAPSEAVCELYGGEIQRRGGRPAQADARFARAERCFGRERLRLRQAAATLRRAGLAVERGRRAQARAHLAGARRILQRLSSPWLTVQHDHLRGRLDLLDGRPRQALGHLHRAVEGIESIRSRIGLDEFRLSFAADKAPIYADLVEVLLETRSGARAVSEAFAVVERARARALVDLLAGRLGGAETRLDHAGRALVKRLARLRGEVSWLSGLCSGGPGLGAEGRRDESQLARSREMLLEREADIADTMQRLARRHQGLGALAAGETITLDEVQSHLAGDTVLVEYYLNGDRSRAFVIHRDSARVVDLSAAADEIEIALGRLRFQIDKCGYGDDYLLQHEGLLHAGARRHLARLAELVWDPLGVESQRILIVPHGPLHSLPFHALPIGGGLDLVDAAEITCLPSASTLRYLRRAPADHDANGGDSILVVGVDDHRIPKVREEVEQLEQLFPHGRSLRGREATLEALSSAAAEVDYLHVAAHGIFRQDDPFFSALRLADGWLSLYDIYGLQLKARLVSLSACQSGRSWVGGGDEMVGLVRGFLYAGASSLVVSLWPVHDSTTAELMSSFYRSLRAGELPASALRSAMIEVRAKHPHPYHWAPFVLIGPGSRG